MKKLFPIEGNKILLRPFTIEDQAAKNQIDNDDDIKEHICPFLPSLNDSIEEFEKQGYGLVAIVDLTTGDLAGYAKLQHPKDLGKDLGLELVLAIALEARNKGMAQEATQILIKIACGQLNQKQIVVRVAPNNKASLGLVKKLGMKKIDEIKEISGDTQLIYAVTCGKLPG